MDLGSVDKSILKESQSIPTKDNDSKAKIEKMINENFIEYDEVFKALA